MPERPPICATPAARPRWRSRAAGTVVALSAISALTLSGCAAGSTPAASSSSRSGFRGTVLETPIPLTAKTSAVSFTDTANAHTSLGELQQGHLLLLYFGYTHCPDVCPTTMADIGAALKTLPIQVANATKVVFVTSDPGRDTPAVMKAWLANFDTGLPDKFIGLTASDETIVAVADSVGVPIDPPTKSADGSIAVSHGAQVLAFVGGKAKVVWLSGATTEDYAHDISALVSSGLG